MKPQNVLLCCSSAEEVLMPHPMIYYEVIDVREDASEVRTDIKKKPMVWMLWGLTLTFGRQRGSQPMAGKE